MGGHMNICPYHKNSMTDKVTLDISGSPIENPGNTQGAESI